MTEKNPATYARDRRAELVSQKFEQIDSLLTEIVELGASSQRMKMGLQHLYMKYSRKRTL